MKIKTLKIFALLMAFGCMITACSDGKSYAELLNDENKSSNNYLANQRVIPYEKRDSTFDFITGPDAPYYQIDEDANIFMRVINPGTPGNYAEVDQIIYFRFTRFNLHEYADGKLGTGQGNDGSVQQNSAYFRFGNLQSSSYTQWGLGLQVPLQYLSIDCEVDILIKSQYGPSQEIASVVPYLYNVRYFKSMI